MEEVERVKGFSIFSHLRENGLTKKYLFMFTVIMVK